MVSNSNPVFSYNNKYHRDLYNNEMIAAFSIASVLLHLKKATISQLILIMPIITDKKTLDFLSKKSTKVRSIEELVIKRPECLINFNNRYLSNMIVSLNSLVLLQDMKIIILDNKNVYHNDFSRLDFNSEMLGSRLKKIISCSEKLANLLDDRIENLYLQLRVNL